MYLYIYICIWQFLICCLFQFAPCSPRGVSGSPEALYPRAPRNSKVYGACRAICWGRSAPPHIALFGALLDPIAGLYSSAPRCLVLYWGFHRAPRPQWRYWAPCSCVYPPCWNQCLLTCSAIIFSVSVQTQLNN